MNEDRPPTFLLQRGQLLLAHFREARRVPEHQDAYNDGIAMFAASIRKLLSIPTMIAQGRRGEMDAVRAELAEWVDDTLIPESRDEEA